MFPLPRLGNKKEKGMENAQQISVAKSHLRDEQGCTDLGCQVVIVTTFCMVVPSICGSSVWNLLDVTCPVPRV
jgi:hypothetical protein